MPEKLTRREPKIAKTIPLFLLGGFYLLFMVSSSGGFDSGDAVSRYATAKSFLAGEGGALPEGEPFNATVRGRGSKIYTTYSPLQSLLMIPAIALTEPLPISPKAKDGISRTVFNLIFIPLLSATGLVLLYCALTGIGFSPPISVMTVLTIGLGTPYWHYARSAQEENMVSLGLAAWLFGMVRFLSDRKGGLLLASFGACFAVATRWAAAAPIVPLFAGTLFYLMKRWRQTNKAEILLSFLLCVAVIVALGIYNQYRFGSPLETGYRLIFNGQGKSMPLFSFSESLPRALALLFSPYRGLFLYAPILFLFAVGILVTRLRLPPLGLLGIAAFAAAFVLNTGYSFWSAGFSWGPRFLVAPIVLLAPAMAGLYAKIGKRGWWKPILTISVLIQILSVTLPSGTEDGIREQAHIAPIAVANAWPCQYSAMCLRPPLAWEAIRNTVTGDAGPLVGGDKGVPAELDSSDYRTLFWWPFRFAFRFHYFNRYVAAAVVSAVSLLCILLLTKAWAAAAMPLR